MDLKSFKSNYHSQEKPNDAQNRDDVRKKAEEYAAKSDDELLKEIMKTASQGKANGTLNEEQLKAFAQSVSPMLNEEQKARLKNVLDMINRG